MVKICTQCKVEKPLDQYHKDKQGKLGRAYKCKECKRIEARKYYNYTGERKKTFYIAGKEFKNCLKCGKDKEVSEFYPHGKSYVSKCKPCYLGERRTGTALKTIEVIVIDGVDSKECRVCGEVKSLGDYHSSGGQCRGVGGVKARCKPCQREYWAEIREKNPKIAAERSRRWRMLNPEKQAESQRKWRLVNKDKDAVYRNTRKARKELLRDDLTPEQWEQVLNKFGGICALTGEEDNLEMDHFIPISSGFGGTYVGNVYPLNATLNNSKHNRNPFIWYSENKERLGIRESKWSSLLEYLAKKNKMTVPEFVVYVEEVYEKECS